MPSDDRKDDWHRFASRRPNRDTRQWFDPVAGWNHFARLRDGQAQSADTSALHLDTLRNLKRVNAHLVAAAAYPVLENKGDLLPSRLR